LTPEASALHWYVNRFGHSEMTVTATGYQGETRKIDAKTGNRADLVFRLSPAPGGKPK